MNVIGYNLCDVRNDWFDTFWKNSIIWEKRTVFVLLFFWQSLHPMSLPHDTKDVHCSLTMFTVMLDFTYWLTWSVAGLFNTLNSSFFSSSLFISLFFSFFSSSNSSHLDAPLPSRFRSYFQSVGFHSLPFRKTTRQNQAWLAPVQTP